MELRGAVGISVPFDVAACARVLDRGFHLVYAANFLRTMRSKVIEKARRYPGFVRRGGDAPRGPSPATTGS